MSNLRKFTLQAMEGRPLAYSLVSGEIVESGYITTSASRIIALVNGAYDLKQLNKDMKSYISEHGIDLE